MAYKHPAEPEFEGRIGATFDQSEPHWPSGPSAAGKPNVVVVVLDDVGFAHIGCYGSTLETRNMDRLASGGLRYSNFHTTALCSPTRACLLTGRNHHTVRMRGVTNMDTGFPNMRGAIPKSAATLPAILREAGYATFATGKWHLAPMSECTPAGPYNNWPLAKGFDRFYGFMQGETDQFSPELTADNHFITPPKKPEDGYHVSEDITDQAIEMIRNSISLVPEKPFFLYLSYGAMHAPHQAPQSYLDKYKGAFDEGWDVMRERWFARQVESGIIPEGTKLNPRNPGVKPWNELTDNEQKFAARLQEAFAAMMEHTDDQIGRLMGFLEEHNLMDDTIFLLLSDNGSSQEGGATGVLDEMKWFNGIVEDVDEAVKRLDDIGGPQSHSNIPWGWAQAGNSPLKWYKQNTHGGGVRDPLIVHWPKGIEARGEIRHCFSHAIDIAPTLLEVLDIEAPAEVDGVPQMPIHGTSLAETFSAADAKPARDCQFFEMLSHRGIWKDGWKAVTRHESGTPFEDDRWELYHLDEDFSEANDLAEAHPEKLEELKALWWREAERLGALPLDDRRAFALFQASRRPGLPTSRAKFVYYPPISRIVSDACPPIARGWTMRAELELVEGAEGALIARGNINGGFVLYIKDGQAVFDYNHFHAHTVVQAPVAPSPGLSVLEVRVARAEGLACDVTLSLNGSTIATGTIPEVRFMVSSLGMDLGYSTSPVSEAYEAPFAYPARIARVEFELPRREGARGEQGKERAQARAAMAQQ